MSKNKYIINDKEIESGIESGKFKEDGTLIRESSTGQIVKIVKKNINEEFVLPKTLVQINNTFIYQADIDKIISHIINIKDNETFSTLREKYQTILDYLEHYTQHGDNIEKLYDSCLQGANSFESRIVDFIDKNDKKFVDEIDKVENYKPFINTLSSYINLLFIYTLSDFWCYKEKSLLKKTIPDKISIIEEKITIIYQQLLVESYKDNAGKNMINSMDNSLYAKYLFDKNYKIQDIEKFIEYDSRFSTFTDLYAFIKKFHIKKEYQDSKYEINISIKNESSHSRHKKVPKKEDFVNILFNILENLQRLKNIRIEMININDENLNSEKLPFYNLETETSFLLAPK